MAALTSFAKQIIAIIKGDDAEAKAQKIYRGADSAFKTQIASLKGDTIMLEDKVESAKEAVEVALTNNGELISDRNEYIRKLIEANNVLMEAEETLEDHIEKINFLEKMHERINN